MKKILLSLLISFTIISCGSSKKTVSVKGETLTVEKGSKKETEKKAGKEKKSKKKINKETDAIIKTAMSFNGTPYKYGGTTKRGMDCSGLVYTSFLENDISLQRVSYMMATQGKEIRVKDVEEGDLLFFTTSKNKRKINHVGLVVKVSGDDIRFIHSTTSRGVIVSSLSEGYWNYAFNQARRIM